MYVCDNLQTLYFPNDIEFRFSSLEGNTKCSKKYTDTYNHTTQSCQCGVSRSCLLSLQTAPVCHNGRCRCSETTRACIEEAEICRDDGCQGIGTIINNALFM